MLLVLAFISSGNHLGFCPSVRVHKGITIVLSLFRSHWLAVVYCLVLCSGSCEPVHEDRTSFGLQKNMYLIHDAILKVFLYVWLS